MKVVLDTNVLISALVSTQTGSTARIRRLLSEQRFALVISEALLEELMDVMERPHIQARLKRTGARLGDLDQLRRLAEVVSPARSIHGVLRDPDDHAVLEVAVAGQVDYIVTGDQDLLVIEAFEGIRIVKPAVFLAILESEPSG